MNLKRWTIGMIIPLTAAFTVSTASAATAVGAAPQASLAVVQPFDPGLCDPGFDDPGFDDPGLCDPGFDDPGLGDPVFHKVFPRRPIFHPVFPRRPIFG